jgi:hypothetical protein
VVETLRSSRVGRYGSRAALCGAAVLGVSLVGRLAAAWPVFFAALTTFVAVGMLIAGFVINGRRHGSQWRTAWVLLGASLTLLTLSTTVAAAGGFHGNLIVGVRLVEVVSACLAGAGIGGQRDQPVADLSDAESFEFAPDRRTGRRRHPRQPVCQQHPLPTGYRLGRSHHDGSLLPDATSVALLQPRLHTRVMRSALGLRRSTPATTCCTCCSDGCCRSSSRVESCRR